MKYKYIILQPNQQNLLVFQISSGVNFNISVILKLHFTLDSCFAYSHWR